MSKALMVSMRMFSRFIAGLYFNWSQATVYAIATVKNRKVKKIIKRSNMPNLRSRYHGPCFWPNHQIRPSVAVFCSFLRFPGTAVRKNG